MKKYKIAFVVNHFPSVSETFILNQITDLIERGQDVKIFALSARKLYFTHDSIERYKLLKRTTYFKYSPQTPLKRIWRLMSFLLTHFRTLIAELKFRIFSLNTLSKASRRHSLEAFLVDFFNREKFNIVHVHFGQRGAIIADLLEKGRLGDFKFIVTFHGYDLDPSKINQYKLEYKNLFSWADAVTVNTKYLEGVLLRVNPNPKNLIVLPAGLPTEQYKKQSMVLTDPPILYTILYVGRFIELKAPDLAVRIFDILVNERGIKNIKLRMIGDGPLRKMVESLIAQMGLNQHIELLGALSQQMVVEEMSRAHLFLFPGICERKSGRAETQGLVIQEAQAMEVPVLVSDVGGMKYGLLDGISGFVLKEHDLLSFADKAELLIKNDALRVKMGKAGRDFVVKNFDSEILGERLMEIYTQL